MAKSDQSISENELLQTLNSMDKKNDSLPSLTAEAVRAQKERILASAEFKKSKQLSRFLSFVIDETLSGRGDQINQYIIAINAFGRPSDFNPQNDPIVRIEAGRLRRSLSYYYQNIGQQDPLIIDIPTGAYVPQFRRNTTIKSLENNLGSIDSYSVTKQISALPDGPSIVVLPFEIDESDKAQQYFADGLAEQIVIDLNRFQPLLIIGPLRREKLKENLSGPRAIGRQYQAEFVLGGRVIKRENDLKIIVRLMDTQSGSLIWSDAFNDHATSANLFLFGEEVSSKIAARLAGSYGAIQQVFFRRAYRPPVDDFKVYDAVIHYNHYQSVSSDEAARLTIDALQKAIAVDPNNALLKAMLADMYFVDYQYGADESFIILGEKLAREAVRLDQKCQVAHFTLAFLQYFNGEREFFIQEVKQALRFNPNNAMMLAMAGLNLGIVGEWDEGQELMNKARFLNPHFPSWFHAFSFLDSYRQEKYGDALNAAQKFNRPKFFWDPLIRAAVLGQLDYKNKAKTAIGEMLFLRPDFHSRGRELMRRVLFSPENIEMLLAGLYKAGLPAID